jgi:phosphoribosylaminoimidazole-succinocarboxamide synthase
MGDHEELFKHAVLEIDEILWEDRNRYFDVVEYASDEQARETGREMLRETIELINLNYSLGKEIIHEQALTEYAAIQQSSIILV